MCAMIARSATTLVELCLAQAAKEVTRYSCEELRGMPLELGHALASAVVFKTKTKTKKIEELALLCSAFCSPPALSLAAVVPPRHLTASSLSCLGCACRRTLVKLDLSGCTSSIRSLDFLPAFSQLECLILRDCWLLQDDCLAFIHQLQRLQCLDVENIHSITDTSLCYYITGMTTLCSLNLSGTSVTDKFVEALTYGQRLRCWASQQTSMGFNIACSPCNSLGDRRNCEVDNFSIEESLDRWPALEITSLRLQHTVVTQASIPFLLSLQKLLLIDVRNTEIMGYSLQSIKAKFGLVSLPNNSRLMARTNSILKAVTVHASCGCSALGIPLSGMDKQYKPDWVLNWEQDCLLLLLKEASKGFCL